jgi:hypothetical protein
MNRPAYFPFALLCLLGGCTCAPDSSVPQNESTAEANATGANSGAASGNPPNQGHSAIVSGGGERNGSGDSAAHSADSGSQSGVPAAAGTGSFPLPSHYPKPIVGQAVRLDKPVQEPQPGYLIIPDDKPADEFMSGLPPTGEWKSFVMAGTSLSDKGLVFFPRFPAVHTLDASDTRVTDAGCRWLGDARALHTLSLRNTAVTDAGIAHLQKLKTLRFVDLSGTQVTNQGLTGLKQALPGLHLRR